MKSVFTAVLLLATGFVYADTELTFDDGSKVLVKGDRVLFGDDDTNIIYPGSGTTMTVVEHSKQRYMIMDEEFADSVSTQVDAAMAQMQAQLAQLPPEQRAMMEQMMKDRMPNMQGEKAVQEFRRTGRKQEIAGFECVEGELLKNGQREFIMCISSPDEIGMPRSDYEALRSAFAAMADLVGKFSPNTGEMFNLELIGGVPIMSDDQDGDNDSKLKSVSFDTLDEERLSVPENYRQHDPASGM